MYAYERKEDHVGSIKIKKKEKEIIRKIPRKDKIHTHLYISHFTWENNSLSSCLIFCRAMDEKGKEEEIKKYKNINIQKIRNDKINELRNNECYYLKKRN